MISKKYDWQWNIDMPIGDIEKLYYQEKVETQINDFRFCKKHSINRSSFNNWKKKFNQNLDKIRTKIKEKVEEQIINQAVDKQKDLQKSLIDGCEVIMPKAIEAVKEGLVATIDGDFDAKKGADMIKIVADIYKIIFNAEKADNNIQVVFTNLIPTSYEVISGSKDKLEATKKTE